MPLDSSAFQSSDFIQRWLSDVSKNGKDLHDQEQAHDEHAGLRGYGNRIVNTTVSETDRALPSTARVGNNSHGWHQKVNLQATQRVEGDKLSSPCREDGDTKGDVQDCLGFSKRLRSTSTYKRDNDNNKRPKAVNRPPAVLPGSGAKSPVSASESSFAKLIRFRSDISGGRNVCKEQYERRPRHKTKADKYDLKTTSKSRDHGEADTSKKKSSKRRRRKSGLVLNSDFKAPNVAQERLTLKANGGPGMFHNGRVSSSIRRRGLPDLVFPKMDSLTKRQTPVTLKQDSNEQKSKNSKREKARKQQVTQFFERPTAADSCQQTTEKILRGQSTAYMPSESWSRPSSSNQSLTERRRASLNHGVRFHSPPRKDCDVALTRKHWVSDVEQPRVEQFEPHSTLTSFHQQVASPISHYSWSTTPSRRGRSLEATARNLKDNTPSAHSQSHGIVEQLPHAEESPSRMKCKDQIDGDSVQESSVSQLSLDQYIKSTLLDSKNDLWNRFPAQQASTELYTLTSLKHLSHLEKLDVDQRENNALRDEHSHQRPLSCNRSRTSGFVKIDGHVPLAHPSQGQSFKRFRITSNHDHFFAMPKGSLPVDIRGTSNHSTRQVLNSADSIDDFCLRHQLVVNQAKIDAKPFQADPIGVTSMPKWPRRDPSLAPRQSDVRSASIPFAPASQPTMQKHPKSTFRNQSARTRSTIDSAQQIIHDIEQEELLISRRNHVRQEAVKETAGVDVESTFEQPSKTVSRDSLGVTHEYDDSVPAESGAPPEQAFGQTRHGDVFRVGSRIERRRQYSPSDFVAFGRALDRPHPGDVRSTIDPQDIPHSLASHNVLSPAEWQRQHDEQSSLLDFWRPHILY